MKTPNNPWIILCWLVVIVTASFLRFEHLADRPFHFDEATGARITSQRINPHTHYHFNPEHNHGPLLSAAASPVCTIAGESSWKSLTKLSLRFTTAIVGTLLVLVPLLWRRRFGDIPMLASAALLATSPLLVYYSRMYIHEMLLTLCGVAALVLLLCEKPRYVLAGIFVGLMFATKESFAITMIAWGAAGLMLAVGEWKKLKMLDWRNTLQHAWKPILLFFSAAVITATWFYTDAWRNPAGAWDAVRTFFIYKTGAGHDKAFSYYMEMLLIPTRGGIWWFETPVFVLAATALILTYFQEKRVNTRIVRFLAFTTLIHFLIYSAIPYKTPWLMCLPWAYTCLLAGLSLQGFPHWKKSLKTLAALLFLGILFHQVRTTRFATGRFASDTRNPYAYTPTSRDVESIEQWMNELSNTLPPGALEPVAVVGHEYWPLPWYLRHFDSIGYWPDPDPAIEQCPLVFAMPEFVDEMNKRLGKTHIALPRSLRAQVPVMLYLRNDLWETWMSSEPSQTP